MFILQVTLFELMYLACYHLISSDKAIIYSNTRRISDKLIQKINRPFELYNALFYETFNSLTFGFIGSGVLVALIQMPY